MKLSVDGIDANHAEVLCHAGMGRLRVISCSAAMYYSTLTCYKQDKLVLLLEVNKRKMHRFFW